MPLFGTIPPYGLGKITLYLERMVCKGDMSQDVFISLSDFGEKYGLECNYWKQTVLQKVALLKSFRELPTMEYKATVFYNTLRHV